MPPLLEQPIAPADTRRVAFYSHDTQGLGHTRRNLALAAALVSAHPDTDVLLITGNPEAAGLPRPPRTDVVTLPTISKTVTGAYTARVLGSPLEVVLDLRARILEASLSSFMPDLLIVDKVASGVRGELLPALAALREQGGTRVVLGLREVLDEPGATIREWEQSATTAVVGDYYDAVWVYGDPDVYDPVVEYDLPSAVADLVAYTGYLGHGRAEGVRPPSRTQAEVRPPDEPYVLCIVGGGQDGQELARAFAASSLPAGHRGVLITGPFMPASVREEIVELAGDRLTVHEFVPDCETFIAAAAAVVSMGGYNSVCELLAAGRPSLVVPRVVPRLEQLIRVERLADRGLLDYCHPDDLGAGALTGWMAAAVAGPVPDGVPVDLDGLRRVPQLADRLLADTVVPAAVVTGSFDVPALLQEAGRAA